MERVKQRVWAIGLLLGCVFCWGAKGDLDVRLGLEHFMYSTHISSCNVYQAGRTPNNASTRGKWPISFGAITPHRGYKFGLQ